MKSNFFIYISIFVFTERDSELFMILRLYFAREILRVYSGNWTSVKKEPKRRRPKKLPHVDNFSKSL